MRLHIRYWKTAKNVCRLVVNVFGKVIRFYDDGRYIGLFKLINSTGKTNLYSVVFDCFYGRKRCLLYMQSLPNGIVPVFKKSFDDAFPCGSATLAIHCSYSQILLLFCFNLDLHKPNSNFK